MNIDWSRKILEELRREGIREIVFCAGARNSPLVAVLANGSGFETQSFFEERSAAFFALGAARRSGRPVAVITTSGTAAAELLPAVIEAYHTGVPLVLLTADRPKRLRGTGAPQAIDQLGLFGKFVGHEFDLEAGEPFSLASWNRRTPVHLNVCFDEPLLDRPVDQSSDLLARERRSTPSNAEPGFRGRSSFAASAEAEWAGLRLSRFLQSSTEGSVQKEDSGLLVVVVGSLETDREREAVVDFLVRLGAPVYLEGPSGIRERPELRDIVLRSGDKLLAWAMKRNLIGRVLRIGGVPTVRIWRDLDESKCPVEVLSLSPLPFAGLSRGEAVCAEIAPTLAQVSVEAPRTAHFTTLLAKDREAEVELRRLLSAEPEAEPSLVHALSKLIPAEALVYIGNSLPIREWDLAAAYGHPIPIEANRGVNGIDGQISTFLGLAEERRENWMVLGDLTALYDLTGPWALSYRPEAIVRIVIVNNGGGKIFSRIFRSAAFENRHGLGFAEWAKMWSLGYRRWTAVPSSLEGAAQAEIIEIVPDDLATTRFWDRYDNIWT